MCCTEPVEGLRREYCKSSVAYLKKSEAAVRCTVGVTHLFMVQMGFHPGSGPRPFLAVMTGCGTVDDCGCTICICRRIKSKSLKTLGNLKSLNTLNGC